MIEKQLKLNRKRCFYTYQALLNDLKKLKMYPESNSLDKQTKYLSKEVKVKQKKMFSYKLGLLRGLKH